MKVTTHNIDEQAPKIEFPCPYPIKVIGYSSADFEQLVLQVLHRHVEEIPLKDRKLKPSSKGNYVSLAVTITATGESQLQALFTELKTLPAVKMVL